MPVNNLVKDIDQLSINVAKGLIMDTVRNANSGHTGGPFSSIDFTYILYKEFLKFDYEDPDWIDRDRFILSAGHESALLYTMLTFIGWIKIDDLKKFRQLDSLTPGHPEREITPGVEATTGPLGQGLGNAIGMAVSEKILSENFGKDTINHYTYCLHSDGDIQEPVSQGSIALAGHWHLGKLIVFYDANDIQISGNVSRSDSTDYVKMYESHGWHVQEINGHNHDEIRTAIRLAQIEIDKPSVIIGKTKIAMGCANMEGNHNTHGAPLPHQEIKETKINLGLDPTLSFNLPDIVLEEFRKGFEFSKREVLAWKVSLENKKNNEKFKKKWDIAFSNHLPKINIPYYDANQKIATRKVWGTIIESLSLVHPTLVGGSADLEPSNVTEGFAKLVGDFSSLNPFGRNFAYGVREFPMGTINNGIALHGGMKVFGATFFVFSDYERPAIRMRAIQGLPVVSEYTHDSFFVGEDGPTHQPVEHIMACRAIPNLLVLRPADANEAIVASKIAFEQTDRPAIVLLSRQGLDVLDRNIYPNVEEFRRGGYIIDSSEDEPEIVIFATGSEVSLALEVKKRLQSKSIQVVNLGCWELFDEQPDEYRKIVLGHSKCFRVSIESGITMGWQKYTGINGLNIGINTFGKSAPGAELAEHFGFSVEKIASKILKNYN